jgi:hypothetical protein
LLAFVITTFSTFSACPFIAPYLAAADQTQAFFIVKVVQDRFQYFAVFQVKPVIPVCPPWVLQFKYLFNHNFTWLIFHLL